MNLPSTTTIRRERCYPLQEGGRERDAAIRKEAPSSVRPCRRKMLPPTGRKEGEREMLPLYRKEERSSLSVYSLYYKERLLPLYRKEGEILYPYRKERERYYPPLQEGDRLYTHSLLC